MELRNAITSIIGFVFTIGAVVLWIKGFWIEGFLAAILGELIDMPQRIAEHLTEPRRT
ncbi:MAG: hypothetical protein UT82_C0028G0014 [Parcubacteria group bacterium GW2011_GWB1_40_14]|nr:MAG: hypothetical protein UT82_C0028G0014 [Parcubacteria group bacterium GW2011_GWB1_40_14]